MFKFPGGFKFQKTDFLIGFLLLGIFLLGFFVSYEILKLSKIFVPKPVSTPAAIFSEATPGPVNNNTQQKGVYNLLFLGYGGAGHAGGTLTDSIIIVHVNTNDNQAALVSVPRDLWVNGNHKINAAGIEGFQNSGPVVQNVTGLPVNYFVSVDFGGFVKLIDDLGGVTVNNPATMDDPFYPITGQENNTCGFSEDQINQLKTKYSGAQLEFQFTCRYEHLHFDKGTVNLDGTTALKFVRSRHGDSDFGRSARQFAVLLGIEQKLISLKGMGKIDSTIDTLSKIVRTDLDAGTIKSLLDVFGDTSKYNATQIHLTLDNVLAEGKASDGEYILYPKAGMFNFDSIRSYISANIK